VDEGEWRQKYNTYMQSARWRNTRQDRIKMAGNCCESCGVSGTYNTLQCHHLTYERLGHEDPRDLKILCIECHEKEDKKREHATEERRVEARFEAGLDTYARKKYGLYWEDRHDAAHIEEEFADWLERKEDNYW